jgi:DNA replication and repair protein RecF
VPLTSSSEFEDLLRSDVGLHPTVSREEVDRIEGSLAAQLARTRAKEIARGMTLVGPHRDEVRFLVDGVDMRTYGSRGQQRTVALALKLAEFELMHEEIGETPILLLDDVLSELDTARRDCLLRRLAGIEQAIMTTTDLQFFPADFLDCAILWSVQDGCIQPTASTIG